MASPEIYKNKLVIRNMPPPLDSIVTSVMCNWGFLLCLVLGILYTISFIQGFRDFIYHSLFSFHLYVNYGLECDRVDFLKIKTLRANVLPATCYQHIYYIRILVSFPF